MKRVVSGTRKMLLAVLFCLAAISILAACASTDSGSDAKVRAGGVFQTRGSISRNVPGR